MQMMFHAVNRKIIVLLAAVAVAALSSWLLQVVGTDDEREIQSVPHDPDYYLKKFNVTFFNDDGKPSQLLSAPSMVHYPDTDTVEVVKPDITIIKDSASKWRITSEQGWLSANASIIRLWGNVDLQRQAKGYAPSHVLTPELYVFPLLNYAETDSNVTIRDLSGAITGIGLKVFVDEGKFSILSEVKGHYAAHR